MDPIELAPVLADAAIERSVDSLWKRFESGLERDFNYFKTSHAQRVNGLLRQAYAEGLRDGFAQGAAAQARAAVSPE